MTRRDQIGGCLLWLGLVACGAGGPTSDGERGPTECADTTPRETAPAGCWADHYPIQSCSDPARPELVGLWGRVEGQRWRPVLVYDGCCVTSESLPVSPPLWLMQAETTYGRSPNVGMAWRSQGVWQRDTLSVPGMHGQSWRAEPSETGAWRFVNASDEEGQPLTRFDEASCVDSATRDLLCARLVAGAETPRVRHLCLNDPTTAGAER